jgi:prolyl-tRNA editing enzyme YbaK/EbsC (Cys-tRNA(Pro) deacylase)
MSDWPEPVERVVGFLRSSGTEAVVEEFPQGTPTARDAAEAVGAELRQIVKSLVFACGPRNVLVMVPGDRRADGKKVAAAAGSDRAKVAGPELVLAATGFEPGAVAPFPLRSIDRVFIDRSLLALDRVWIGAGSTRHMAALAPADLVRLARAEPLDAVEDPDRARS